MTDAAAMRGSAPSERVAPTMAAIHDGLIAELAPRSGERWLDIGAGTGAVALRAARAGATVTGVDIAPPLRDAFELDFTPEVWTQAGESGEEI